MNEFGGDPNVRRRVEATLRLPLFYKIVLANATIITLAVAGGVMLTTGPGIIEAGRPISHVAVPLIVAGVAACALVNALIVRLALDPVRSLVETAARVQGGDLQARAPESPLADRELAQLIDAFNDVLDSAAAYRLRLREVAARSKRVEEEERRRVARALHDDTAQRLAALMLRMRATASGPGAVEEGRALLEEARAEVAGALEVVRGYALGRRPPSLDELGLRAAIESYADDVVADLDAVIRIDLDGHQGQIASEVELTLFRIGQEALDNVARHSGASRVEVTIARSGESLVAVIEDDGRGFEPHRLVEEECLGLFEMRERAAAVGGHLEVRSAPSRGTRVEADLPVALRESAGE